MTTAKEYLASFGKRKPNLQEVEELYRLRERDVQAIAAKPVITVADIQTLEWGGRFQIANEYLDKCDEQARAALLHDQHHGVRSAATLFKPRERATPAPAAVTPAPAPASASEIATAIMNGKARIKTLHGEKSAAGVEAMILSTHPREALQKAESFIAGFEGDELQDSVNEVLALLRHALKPLQ